MKGNAPLNTLKPQPGQGDQFNPKFHPLPGQWAQEQIAKQEYASEPRQSKTYSSSSTELQKALASERQQHEYWEDWQGVKPGKPEYVNPRGMSDSLQPRARYGTEGPGYG
jgi:hypothetical protein